jgi:gluconokinase
LLYAGRDQDTAKDLFDQMLKTVVKQHSPISIPGFAMTIPFSKTRAVLVMGVSGSGKSTIGTALAERLDWIFADADDYHPSGNRKKMSRGEALDDSDRLPWLQGLRELLEQHLREHRPVVLACSALKATYRDVLTRNLDAVQVVFLQGGRELIAERMRQREHFMPLNLLESQLATLEPPDDAIVVDIDQSVQEVLLEIEAKLRLV